ncbi:TrmH family RNA methyltransferase [Aquabacter cavernae]|uniref:TrmH family RNA methyltransferase n=1 Tax=Aquabacter cavernae TaxID=2496029 RepID=UPI000F8D5354|nr:RNA methyltransferase [Aquabacter cavernae]
MMQSVTDPGDPRVAGFLSVRERDLVGRQGLFMAEGEVVLRLVAGRPDHIIRSVLLSEASARRLSDLPDLGDAPVYVAAQDVMDAIAGFHIHRGILALVEPPPAPQVEALLAGLPARARVVGLCGIANHDNMGGIFRNAAAFGAHAVLLDAACCDPLYRKAIRVSVGACLTVPFARVADGVAMVRLLEGAGVEVVSLSPSGTMALSAYVPAARTAALFGTEGPGLPADILAATRTVSIPMAPGFDSLNVATTSGIVLHHLAGE